MLRKIWTRWLRTAGSVDDVLALAIIVAAVVTLALLVARDVGLR